MFYYYEFVIIYVNRLDDVKIYIVVVIIVFVGVLDLHYDVLNNNVIELAFYVNYDMFYGFILYLVLDVLNVLNVIYVVYYEFIMFWQFFYRVRIDELEFVIVVYHEVFYGFNRLFYELKEIFI